jgi:hypothetical protein
MHHPCRAVFVERRKGALTSYIAGFPMVMLTTGAKSGLTRTPIGSDP